MEEHEAKEMLEKIIKPLGGKTTKSDWSEYEKRAFNFCNGKFKHLESVPLMTGEKSRFSRKCLKPQDEFPVHKLKKIPEPTADGLNYIWLGHSSSYLQMGGKNILIDPVFSKFSSPFQWIGPKRFSECPITEKLLPVIDIVLISHDHYDHLDYHTILKIDKKTKNYIVPLGVEKHLLRWGVSPEKIHTMAWWEELQIGNLKITSCPGQHFTNRLPWRSNTTLWCGYSIQTDNRTVYFTGDTGYGQFFKEIHERIGDVDLLLLECGQYDHAWAKVHSFPEEGIQIMQDLEADWTIPVHWGAFCICNHSWDHSVKRISRYAKEQGKNLAVPMIGQVVDFEKISEVRKRWWRKIK